jgi:hypothetical protein
MLSDRWKVETASRGVGYILHLNFKCFLYYVTCNYFYITYIYFGNINIAVREIIMDREALQVLSLWHRLVTINPRYQGGAAYTLNLLPDCRYGSSITQLLNSMELNTSWDIWICSGIKEIFCVFWKPKVYYRSYKSPSLIPILSQNNAFNLRSVLILYCYTYIHRKWQLSSLYFKTFPVKNTIWT